MIVPVIVNPAVFNISGKISRGSYLTNKATGKKKKNKKFGGKIK